MANKLAALKFTLTYPAAGGGTGSVPSTTVSCPFQSQDGGIIDIPDTTPQATAFDVPFGSIDNGATLLVVFNKLADPVTLKVNGGDLENEIPGSDCAVIACGNSLGGTPITAATVTTTALQTGAGSVEFLVFGDPT